MTSIMHMFLFKKYRAPEPGQKLEHLSNLASADLWGETQLQKGAIGN